MRVDSAGRTLFAALMKAKNADEAQLHRRRKWLADGLGYLDLNSRIANPYLY